MCMCIYIYKSIHIHSISFFRVKWKGYFQWIMYFLERASLTGHFGSSGLAKLAAWQNRSFLCNKNHLKPLKILNFPIFPGDFMAKLPFFPMANLLGHGRRSRSPAAPPRAFAPRCQSRPPQGAQRPAWLQPRFYWRCYHVVGGAITIIQHYYLEIFMVNDD
jgi:hypothetical protein